MYTFFINNTAISFQRKSTIEDAVNPFVYSVSSVAEVNAYLLVFLNQMQAMSVIFSCDNPDNIVAELQKEFGMIEAGGGIVKNNKEEILFIYRRNRWDLPKGKLDAGETIEACAVREVQEECGIKEIKLLNQALITHHFFIPKKKQGFTIKKTTWFHMLLLSDEQPVPQEEEGITDIKWFGKNDLHIPLSSTFAMVQYLLKEMV